MKVLHIVEDFSLNSGGLRTVVKDLYFFLEKQGVAQIILSSNKEEDDDVQVVSANNSWLYSSNWKKTISELNNKHNFDFFHIHGVWLYPQYIAAKFCIKNKIPFIISFHGMYEPWLWEKGTIKKKIYFNLLTKQLFKKASFHHVITPQEKQTIINLFKTDKTVEIPNLISKNNFKVQAKEESNYVLFLGRLDEKKGIDLLVKAFGNLNKEGYKLFIAGKKNRYKNELEHLINKLGIKNKVNFLGLVSGQEKQELICNATVLVAPSHSEVIGMVNLEAGILKTPVITTHQTGIDSEWNNNGGKLINPNVVEIETALQEILDFSVDERIKMGKTLHDFIVKKYSWENRIKDWITLYKSVKNGE